MPSLLLFYSKTCQQPESAAGVDAPQSTVAPPDQQTNSRCHRRKQQKYPRHHRRPQSKTIRAWPPYNPLAAAADQKQTRHRHRTIHLHQLAAADSQEQVRRHRTINLAAAVSKEWVRRRRTIDSPPPLATKRNINAAAANSTCCRRKQKTTTPPHPQSRRPVK